MFFFFFPKQSVETRKGSDFPSGLVLDAVAAVPSEAQVICLLTY